MSLWELDDVFLAVSAKEEVAQTFEGEHVMSGCLRKVVGAWWVEEERLGVSKQATYMFGWLGFDDPEKATSQTLNFQAARAPHVALE